MGIILGLISGVTWGLADFCGGFASRRMSAITVAAVSQMAGLVVVAAALLVVRPDMPSWGALGLGALGGVCGGLGVLAFYRALAIGTMSLIAPISALGAGVPVVFGLIDGERPSTIAFAGALLALAGAVLASKAPGHAARQGLGLAVVAALGFGGFFILITPAADTSVLWAGLSTKMASVPVLAALCLISGAGFRVGKGLWRFVIISGVLDVLANLAYAAATTHGLLSIVSVLSGLYPVSTVILAQVVLKERLSPGQATGVGAALAGVALIAAG